MGCPGGRNDCYACGSGGGGRESSSSSAASGSGSGSQGRSSGGAAANLGGVKGCVCCGAEAGDRCGKGVNSTRSSESCEHEDDGGYGGAAGSADSFQETGGSRA